MRAAGDEPREDEVRDFLPCVVEKRGGGGGNMTDWVCQKSVLRGAVDIPGSKSHTIRSVVVAALADGESRVEAPLLSEDTRAALRVYRALGMECCAAAEAIIAGGAAEKNAVWTLQGTGGAWRVPDDVLNAGNSGTTTNIALGSCAALRAGAAILTGDAQIRRRPAGTLADALNRLGAKVSSTRNNGLPPFVAQGPLRGGPTEVGGKSSQYLTSLLFCAPLAERDVEIRVEALNEKPYVEMTLAWLKRQGVNCECDASFSRFFVPAGQKFQAFRGRIPADFSTATFFLCAGALPGNDLLCRGLDLNDTQGDKAVVEYLKAFGARVETTPDGIRVCAAELRGVELDLNATPDALPMLAVLACFARGVTKLTNVAQARIKETDRIAVMRAELTKLGAKVRELPDGLVIEESPLRGAPVNGHDDHRVVMALAVGASAIEKGETTISTVEAAAVTYPTFAQDYGALGGNLA
jgi:3-phosphoshikimate 1-carboxyvinyltransferase